MQERNNEEAHQHNRVVLPSPFQERRFHDEQSQSPVNQAPQQPVVEGNGEQPSVANGSPNLLDQARAAWQQLFQIREQDIASRVSDGNRPIQLTIENLNNNNA
jgi:hypothetical protein